MKERILTGLLSGALGLLLLFFGVNLLNVGANPNLATGIAALLIGLGYLGASALFVMRFDEKIPLLGKIGTCVTLLGYPTYLLIEIIVTMSTLGAGNIGIAAWIMDILILGAIAGLCAFEILIIVGKDNKVFRINRDAALGCVLILLPLMLVFRQNGAVATLGGITVFDLVTRCIFFGLAFFVLKDSLLFVKDKLTSEKPLFAFAPKAEAKEEVKEEAKEEAKEEPKKAKKAKKEKAAEESKEEPKEEAKPEEPVAEEKAEEPEEKPEEPAEEEKAE